MHCIQCGTQNADSTRFCTRCGYNLENLSQILNGTPTDGNSESVSLIGPRHVSLILLIAGFFAIIGLLTIFITIGVLATQPTKIPDHALPEMLLLIGVAGLASIVLVVGLLLRMISGAKNADSKSRKKKESKVLAAPKIAALPPQSVESFGSVIEQTTSRLPEYNPPQLVETEVRRHTK